MFLFCRFDCFCFSWLWYSKESNNNIISSDNYGALVTPFITNLLCPAGLKDKIVNVSKKIRMWQSTSSIRKATAESMITNSNNLILVYRARINLILIVSECSNCITSGEAITDTKK